MDKEYLIHNIKLSDNGYDHSTMDIGLKIKEVEDNIIADVTVSTHTVINYEGEIEERNTAQTFENVSLTGGATD